MASEAARKLAGARWIAVGIYAAVLVIFPLVGRHVRLEASLDPAASRILLAALGMVAIADYALSLFLEERMLSGGGSGRRAPPATTALVVASVGASLAAYGLVASLLIGQGSGFPFYALALVHWVHLMLRWPSYERAAENAF